MHMMMMKHGNTREAKEIHWEKQNVFVGRIPLGKIRLCWRDETLLGKETSLRKAFRTREVKASSFTRDEKRGHPLSLGIGKYASSFTGESEYLSFVHREHTIVPLMI